MGFKKQAAKARAYSLNSKWKKNQIGSSLDYRYKNASLSSDFLDGGRLADLAKRAYSSPRGYVISKNVKTGDVEMFVKGTSTGGEWIQNGLESPIGAAFGAAFVPAEWARRYSFKKREDYAKELSEIAEKNGVDIVYGHSRGGAVIGDMNGRFKKVGLDGAMLLNRWRRNDFINVRQKTLFDSGIGYGGKKTLKTRWRPPWQVLKKKYHYVWSDLK